MSDIESEEYEIMDVPVSVKTEEIEETEDQNVEFGLESSGSSSMKTSNVLPHSIISKYTVMDIVENPKKIYVISTSEYCDNITELTGEFDCIECPGNTCFELRNKNWVSSAKMELTLTLNRDKLQNKKDIDASKLSLNNQGSISIDTDELDPENTDFRVVTFTYSKDSSFTIKTDLAYNWTLRTLNNSEFTLKLSYEPELIEIVKNLKNIELKTASKKRFNVALQKIYIEQLKKDGNYYCAELKSAKDKIHNLNVDLKETRDQISCLEEECESIFIRKEALLQKNKSFVKELENTNSKLKRMKFLKDYYCSETKIAKNKQEFSEKKYSEIQDDYSDFKEKYDELKDKYDDLNIDYTDLFKERNTIKNEYSNLCDDYDDLDEDYENLKKKYDTLTNEHVLFKNNKTEIIEQAKNTQENNRNLENDLKVYKNLAQKYNAKLELKERDIENLENIINEYKKELNKPMKYREEVKTLESDNKYLKKTLANMKKGYNNLRDSQSQMVWGYEDEITKLKNEITYLKERRVNKNKLENDISEFHRRGYDMIDWYRNNNFNQTNEFVQFQRETEFLFNDVLNYFKSTLQLDKDKKL